MCINQRKIVNRYTHKEFYVKCGHCPACLQEKASYRVSRIKAQDSSDLECILIGLTYRRHDCPYILRDDAYMFSKGLLKSIPIYRDVKYRKVRQNAAYDISYKKYDGPFVLSKVDFVENTNLVGTKDLVHKHGCIGVTYYPDVQDFLDRLRINLKRNFSYDEPFKTYCCSEYGTGTRFGKGSLRPHFHILLWCKKGDFEVMRNAIIASWPYGDLSLFPRAIEKAFRASSYVASYVNCGSNFPVFLRKYFKPKHSYSKGFGMESELFSLDKILEKFSGGHLTYFMQKTVGTEISVLECPFPKYVIHRYFPKFKGYGRMSASALLSIMQRIRNGLYESDRPLGRSFYETLPIDSNMFLNDISQNDSMVYYSDEDIHKIGVRLDNAYSRFLGYRDISFLDYCKLHLKIWSLYASDILRLHLQNEDIPLVEKYDNLDDVLLKRDEDFPVGFTRQMILETNPNKFNSTIVNTARFEQSFYEHQKHRAVNNAVLSSLYEEF